MGGRLHRVEEPKGEPCRTIASLPLGHPTLNRGENLQFFVNSCAWSTVFSAYVFAVLISNLSQRDGVDGQMIALAAM
jgi:hypothetical protein